MDTKLKRYNVWLKVLSLVVFIVSATISVSVIADLKKINEESRYYLNDFTKENYYETSYFQNKIVNAEYYISELHTLYNDTETSLAIVGSDANEDIIALFNQETNYIYNYDVQSNGGMFNEFMYSTTEAENAMNDFQITHSAEITDIAKNNIESTIIAINKDINNNFSSGLVYFFTAADGTVVTNTSFTTAEDFEAAYSTISGGEVNPSYNYNEDYQFAFKEDYLTSEFIIPFEESKESYNENDIPLLTASIILMIPSFCYTVFAAGRRNLNQVNMLKVDKIFVDLNIVLLSTMAFSLLASVVLIDDGMIYLLSPLVFSIEITIILALVLSLVRHLKNGTIFKHLLIRKVASRIWKIVKRPSFKSNRVSLIVFIILFSLVAIIGFVNLIFPGSYSCYIISRIIFFGLIIVLPIATYLLYIHIIEFEKLSEGAKKIKSGNYDEKIEVNFTKEYNEFADNLNDISSGLSDEVERRLKSERMKTDLITNVSHDLKTPLTSFITYVDLLKKENIEDEKIQGYIDVLDQKSARLKVLVDDLVDSAKASSGTVQVSLDKVEVNSLISQCLGELDDVISKSEINFRVKMPIEKLHVHADGKLLWRVVNNLIDNILKYSLPNTRVYINVFENGDDIILEFKNISADELNISEDELLERFVRGDESRNTKGSGLGLNIAKSLMTAQNGELAISIDGDAFKAVVKIHKYNV